MTSSFPENKNSAPIEGDWRNRAACIGSDPELFFPTGPFTRGPGLDQQDKAKEVCGRCAVRETCLQYALEKGENFGVWGGLGEDERRALRRRVRGRMGRRAVDN